MDLHIPFNWLANVGQTLWSAPTSDSVRIGHASLSQRFVDFASFGWLASRFKAADRQDERPAVIRHARQFTESELDKPLPQLPPLPPLPAVQLRPAPKRERVPGPDFDSRVFAPPSTPGPVDPAGYKSTPSCWSDEKSRKLGRFIDKCQRQVAKDLLTPVNAKRECVKALRKLMLGQERYQQVWQGDTLEGTDAITAGSPDHLRYYQLVNVIADAFKTLEEAAQEIVNTEPDEKIRDALLQRLEQTQRGQWEKGCPAPDAPSIEGLQTVSHLVTNETNELCVMRNREGTRMVSKIARSAKDDQYLLRDCATQRKILEATNGRWHPNLIRLYGALKDRDSNGISYPRLLMQEARGAEWGEVIQALSEARDKDPKKGGISRAQFDGVIEFVAERLDSVAGFLKGARFGHNDIKPENVIIDELGEPMVIDTECASRIGKPADGLSVEHAPPERLVDVEASDLGITSEASEMFTIGSTLRAGMGSLKGRKDALAGFVKTLLQSKPEKRPGVQASRMHPVIADRILTDAEARKVLRDVMQGRTDATRPGLNVAR